MVVKRAVAVKMQGLKWRDFSGLDTEVPYEWHEETQAALEELNAWEAEEHVKQAKAAARRKR